MKHNAGTAYAPIRAWAGAVMAALSFIALAVLSGSALAQKADRPAINVGDQWQFFKTDDRRAPSRNFAWIITSVTPEGIVGTENGEPLKLTPDLNLLESAVRKNSDLRMLSFPLEVGKSWAVETEFLLKDTGSKGHAKGTATVRGYENVRVPAGEFDAFKLETTLDVKGRAAAGFDYTGSSTYTYWYAPAARMIVRQDIVDFARGPYRIELTGFVATPSTSPLGTNDEALLGKAEGYPVCPLAQATAEQRCLVGTISHFDQVVPARKVAKPAAPRALKRTAKEPPITYTFRDQPGSTIESFLQRSRNTGLLVLQGDTILVERYKYDRTPEQRFQSYSMAKTVVGMLVGIALAEKKIDSIDDPAEKYVPALKGHPYGATTLRHLLTMSSGVKFSETYDGSDDVSVLSRKALGQQGPGGVDTVSTFTQRDRPAGEKFSYSSGESQVLGLVLRAAVGKPLAEYLSEKIWQPMGAEADATWLTDAGGFETGYMGINATLRDWGRLGMLLANGGELDGKQIIPAEWVRAATVRQAPPGEGMAYGYQTWVIGPEERMFALVGVRGQAVMIDPRTKVVVVHTAVHGRPANDPLRAEQYELFFGAVNSLK